MKLIRLALACERNMNPLTCLNVVAFDSSGPSVSAIMCGSSTAKSSAGSEYVPTTNIAANKLKE